MYLYNIKAFNISAQNILTNIEKNKTNIDENVKLINSRKVLV